MSETALDLWSKEILRGPITLMFINKGPSCPYPIIALNEDRLFSFFFSPFSWSERHKILIHIFVTFTMSIRICHAVDHARPTSVWAGVPHLRYPTIIRSYPGTYFNKFLHMINLKHLGLLSCPSLVFLKTVSGFCFCPFLQRFHGVSIYEKIIKTRTGSTETHVLLISNLKLFILNPTVSYTYDWCPCGIPSVGLL